MGNKTEHRYFQFPLCLLQNILIDTENGINLVIDYSIVKYAKKMEYEISGVARQLVYDFYRNENVIQSSLRKNLNRYVKNDEFTFDEEYNGFIGNKEFDPDINIGELEEIFNSNKEFEQQAILHYQVHCAAKKLNLQHCTVENTIPRYEKAKALIKAHEAKYGTDPTPGIKTELLFEFRNKKNTNEIELLCGLIAMKSIIGQKNFTATYKSVIAMRMIGAKSKEVLTEHLQQKELKSVYEKYSKRYPMDKLIEKLFKRKFIQSKVSFGRQIFISTKFNMDELGDSILEHKEKKDIKKKEREVRQRISEGKKSMPKTVPKLEETIKWLQKMNEGTYIIKRMFNDNDQEQTKIKIQQFIDATNHIIENKILPDFIFTFSQNFENITKKEKLPF